jgi:uncharacterized membrane protein
MQAPLPLKWLKRLLIFLFLFYASFYLPMAGVLYSPFWYKANCGWHERCERFGSEKAFDRIDELVGFLRHTSSLSSPDWTLKEKWHLEEVRRMFDLAALIFLGALGALLLFSDAASLRSAALAGIVLLILLCSVLPFFDVFWKDIFHKWLFDNTYWKNNPKDVSYYIMPRVFFKYTVAFIIAASALINTGILLAVSLYRKKR